MQLVFQDWIQSALHAAVEWLIGRYRSDSLVDLDRVVIVVPGGRAGRRLREVLLARIEQLELGLLPPSITTAGQLPELLYPPRRKFASPLTEQLAWTRALRESDHELTEQVIAGLPAGDDDLRWVELGGLLRNQYRELAGEEWDFSGVAGQGAQIEGFDEQRRWEILAGVQQRYLRMLDSLQLWDRQTARLEAIKRKECRFDGQVVLLGMADMNRTLRRMLDQVAEQVTVLVHAPPALADRFDAHGCLVPTAWQDAPMAVATEQVRLVDGPADQADELLRVIAALDQRYRADQITVGVPDETLVPHLQRRLAQHGVAARWGPGRPLADSGPYKWLMAVAALLEHGGFADFAALVHHCDMTRWIEGHGVSADWLTPLDSYYTQHLPARWDGDWLGMENQWRLIHDVRQHVRSLLQPLTGAARPPGAWSESLTECLLSVYGVEPWDLDDPGQRQTVLACKQLCAAIESMQEIPGGLAPNMTSAATIRLALRPLQSTCTPSTADEDAIELLGWLELPLDDAPAMVVTSFHEGVVPESVNSDLFLPNTLRARLGLDDNARRYARDAYSLSTLLASREQLTLIVARRDREGNPVLPSRLLFATDEATVAERSLIFFQPPAESYRSLPDESAAMPARSAFRVPRPVEQAEPIARISPTALRAYLTCPYRFYLEHILRLRPVSDDAEELDGAAFGSLLHEVLRRFGDEKASQSNDAAKIAGALDGLLSQCAAQQFGRRPVAAVSVQIAQLRLRLKVFAEKQAQWVEQGWRIAHTEVTQQGAGVEFPVDGQPFHLAGRIDRIDVHRETGQHAILDYKSSDAGEEPEKVHRRGNEWIDLQLPLYRHLARGIGVEGPVRLGYVLLPKDPAKAGFALAEWTEQQLQEADEVARDVVRSIRRQVFWPPAELPASWTDAFAPICQVGVFDRDRNMQP